MLENLLPYVAKGITLYIKTTTLNKNLYHFKDCIPDTHRIILLVKWAWHAVYLGPIDVASEWQLNIHIYLNTLIFKHENNDMYFIHDVRVRTRYSICIYKALPFKRLLQIEILGTPFTGDHDSYFITYYTFNCKNFESNSSLMRDNKKNYGRYLTP